MRVAFAEWPDGLMPSGSGWDEIVEAVQEAQPDLLVTDQMPFGPWLPSLPRFDRAAAMAAVALHDEGVEALASLRLPAVVTTRPAWLGEGLVNLGVVIEADRSRYLHTKQILVNQEGWREPAWFGRGSGGFLTADVIGVRIGMLFCTELMFNEYARKYGEDGAELIVVPRATPASSRCELGAAMAAVVSGSYVISSSRVGCAGDHPAFGGRGLAFAPNGELLAKTSQERKLVVVEIDPRRSRLQRCKYPCYLTTE
jgi:N-carbamoylputrescine amidase